MLNAKIILPDNTYGTDSFMNVISYIYRCTTSTHLPIACYGTYTFPPTYQSLCKDFQTVYDRSLYSASECLWHFILSFPESIPIPICDLCQIADDIAFLLGQQYPVCYSYHTDTMHPHFHYIACTSSYYDNYPPLNAGLFQEYLKGIGSLCLQWNISLTVTDKGGKLHV